MGGTLVVAAAMGLGLWYSINSAYYYKVDGVTEVLVAGDAMPVSDYRGIDADTSPLKMRACFTGNWDFPADPAPAAGAEPLVAPAWFDCFDAVQISEDLQTGAAKALLSSQNVPYGFDTFIAHYPDGRGFMWRQVNRCGEALFNGSERPDGCPDPDAQSQTETGAASSKVRLSADTPKNMMEERT
jgi:hypothetical protein